MGQFSIQVEDGSTFLPEFVVEENTKTMQLYDWQRRAIRYFFKNNCKAIFEVSTGAGKTRCAIEIIKQIWKTEPDCNVLIVVPKNVILETGWYKELYDSGVSLVDIGVYYGRIKEYAKVTITNMQNIHKIAMNIFDMIIYDEIHHFGTERLLSYLKMDFKYKLGLSATVQRSDDKHYEILKIFNYNHFIYSPQEALYDGVLNPFNFFNIGVELDDSTREEYDIITHQINTILMVGGGYKKIMFSKSGLRYKLLSKMNLRKELMNNYKKKVDVVKQIVEKHKNDKIIIFNEYNKQTSKFYWHLLDVGVKACVVHSDMPKEKRELNMIGFKKDKYSTILASKVLDEGWNLPAVDVAVISAGNSTSRQTIQRMGRVLRKKKYASNLYQIYCDKTVEAGYAHERGKLFRELCSDYKSYYYVGGKIKW